MRLGFVFCDVSEEDCVAVMWATLESFPFLGRRAKALADGQPSGGAPGSPRTGALKNRNVAPSLKVSLEKKVYRPGDTVVAILQIGNEAHGGKMGVIRDFAGEAFLMEDLSVEVRGIEKLDPQWLVTPKPPAGSKTRRGERAILKSPSAVIVSDALVSQGSRISYMVRVTLPRVLPPTFRGTVVRYFYYMTAAIHWSRCAAENGRGPLPPPACGSERLEVRTALPIWTLSHSNGLTSDEAHYGESGIVPPYALEVEIEWKENSTESTWAWATDASVRNGEERLSTPKSSGGSTFTSPTTSVSIDNRFDRSYSIPSRATPLQLDPSFVTPSSSRRDLVLSNSTSMADFSARSKQSGALDSGLVHKRAISLDSLTNESYLANMNVHYINGDSIHSNRVAEDSVPDSPHSPAAIYNQGKSYNIRMDDEVLVKFSPKNSTSSYFFGDMVAGTLQFFHNDKRRCLEVIAVLETREILNPAVVHPSRKNSSTITKVHSEYYEIVNEVTNTQFLFSIPLDGPASMTTPLLSLEWILRFEFVATPPNVDWNKVEHPMLTDVNQRRKGEWALPITVHSTPPKQALPEAENFSRNSWARSSSAIYKSLIEETPESRFDKDSASGSESRH